MIPLLFFQFTENEVWSSAHSKLVNRSRAKTASEQSLLLFERAEAADIGYRKRDAKLVFVAYAKVKAPVLHAETATVGVVGNLRGCELHDALPVVVYGVECGVPSAMIRVAEPDAPAKLVGFGREKPRCVRVRALALRSV